MSQTKQTFPRLPTGKYLHTKSGHFYEVLGVTLQTETDEALVVYRPLDKSEYELYARPYEMFVESVEIGGRTVPRFEKVISE